MNIQVWFSLGLTLIVMSPVLAALSELYVRYVESVRGDESRQGIITFEGLLHNSTFLLSHLTNQGKFKFTQFLIIFKFLSVFVCAQVFATICV